MTDQVPSFIGTSPIDLVQRGKSFVALSLPGIALAAVVAMAASFISAQLRGPAMLYALLLGMTFNFLAHHEKCASGVQLCAKPFLKLGVALLGARIAVGDIFGLGWFSIALVIACIATTLSAGWLIGRAFGLRSDHAILSAGAVAICGASAALAISSVLPSGQRTERNTLITIVIVTGLSTVAMVLYPLIAQVLGLSAETAGFFLGATIHDVAQVMGAGYMISPDVADTATIVKLMRVACLAPVVIIIGLLFRAETQGMDAVHMPVLPPFLIGFVALVIANSAGIMPPVIADAAITISQWCMIAAVAALGIKTSIKEMIAPGFRPLLVLCLQTALLAIFALSLLLFVVGV